MFICFVSKHSFVKYLVLKAVEYVMKYKVQYFFPLEIYMRLKYINKEQLVSN